MTITRMWIAGVAAFAVAQVVSAVELPFPLTIGGHPAKDEGRLDAAAVVKEAVAPGAEVVIQAQTEMVILNISPVNDDGTAKPHSRTAIVMAQGTNKVRLDQTLDKKPLAAGLYRMTATAADATAIVLFRIGEDVAGVGGKTMAQVTQEAEKKAEEATQKAMADLKKAKEEEAARAKQAAMPKPAEKLTDEEAATRLAYASQYGEADKVKALLASNPKIVNMNDSQAFQAALSLQKGPEIVKAFLDAGADAKVKQKESGCNTIILAIDGAKPSDELTAVVKMLVEKSADVNCPRVKEGYTALHLAARQGMKDVMAVLLTAKNVDVNQRCNDLPSSSTVDDAWPPLFYAVSRGDEGQPDDLKVVEMLLAKGADVKAATRENLTALHLVARNGRDRRDIAELLVSKGAALDPISRPFHLTPLHEALMKDNPEICKLLLERGANVNIPNDQGVTIIQHAHGYYVNWKAGKVIQQGARGSRR
ncbi:MAG: ankyrin repeat domain-containing protein [Verrucomicrobia bacterium]|nr:ankyrin repeat domain-containing protein [Verrucomicrobiota bacterium]